MLLLCEMNGSEDFVSAETVSLTKFDTVIYHGVKEQTNSNLLPVRILSDDRRVEGVFYALIKSCMRQFCPEHKSTPWEKVEDRLNQYNIVHQAIVRLDPLRVDIVIQ